MNYNPIQEMREEQRRNPFVKKLSTVTFAIIFGAGLLVFGAGIAAALILLIEKYLIGA